MRERFIGIDVGAETVKLVELVDDGAGLRLGRTELVPHEKAPGETVAARLEDWDWASVTGAAVCGRMSRTLTLSRVPGKEALARGARFFHGEGPLTVVSIGSHGFAVLELRDSGVDLMRENSRCSQGTGNFLRQLVERFGLDIEAASALCETVEKPAPLSGRCPVILKTDMTHLANKGEDRARILAGLYDAVCENVQVLLKPRVSPPRVVLAGGVTRSARIRENFRRFLSRHEMGLLEGSEEARLLLEAVGAAVVAAEQRLAPPALGALLAEKEAPRLDRVPSLMASLPLVSRMPRRALAEAAADRPVLLGFDIGSTGSKAVALDPARGEVVWEGYLNTGGDPVGAAQKLLAQFVESDAAKAPVIGFGATGSGREIVGSLMTTCYGPGKVQILNEIAAHAEGALHYDGRVDTIFEIGGQDAKYIRLEGGRVVDAAMNEACSAGTGSFIEEQGRRFSGIKDVVHLGEEALKAPGGVSLGQHCSVFMAEIIDEAVAAGVGSPSIIAGIYDSIIQNYLNRVKGSRSVGQVIFCQGMPFASDALAAAVARQTGSRVVVPPNPGTVGALGIALLATKVLPLDAAPLDPARFLEAKVSRKDTFVCKSATGCGGSGNRCRIDRLRTVVDGKEQRFTWGGACSLWDKGTGRKKLPDLAPSPFRQREELVDAIVERVGQRRGRPTIALTDEFALKGLLPFFATFLHDLGFDLVVHREAGPAALKRGIEEANVPFCAPMQLYHGQVSRMAEGDADWLFLPMIRSLPRVKDEPDAAVCPIVQGSPDLMRWDLGRGGQARILAPTIDVGEGNLFSEEVVDACRRIAESLGVAGVRWRHAWRAAVDAQSAFDASCERIGREALDFCAAHGVTPVVVLGRPYTIYNTVLNSNVPAILREQGAMPIPVDCYPVEPGAPVFPELYWGYGQRNLRAAWQVRRTQGAYAIWTSNYSCGPDSFNLHFFSYLMQGKPFAVIETDGHSGDAGTKTRVEAFLHCVKEDLAGEGRAPTTERLEGDGVRMSEVRRRKETVLLPRMGPQAEVLAACLRGIDIPVEVLARPDRGTVRTGRRHTSGKECVPMTITLGSLLDRLEGTKDDERFVFFMPSARGPCRFGAYNLLHKITLERLGYGERVRVWSPVDADYFDDAPPGLAAVLFAGVSAEDLLLDMLYDARPVETQAGLADATYRRFHRRLLRRIEAAAEGDLSPAATLLQVAGGGLFGTVELLSEAARSFARAKGAERRPTVMVVGEIYVRCDPFSNDEVIEKLEARGLKAKFAPFGEWLEYTDHVNISHGRNIAFGSVLSSFVQRLILARSHGAVAGPMGWPKRASVRQTLDASRPWIRSDIHGEAVLTLGAPVHEWREGHIDGVVSVGPLECMPSKLAEAQFFHVAEKEGLLSLTVPLNGDPIDPEVLDGFAFEVHERWRRKAAAGPAARRVG